MKKNFLLCLLFLLPVQFAAAQPTQPASAESIDWEVKSTWKIDAKPLDIAHTLDNQKVYILGDDHKVHVFAAQGNKLGTIPVDKGVTAIDIAPRGEMLYLIDEQENSFTSLNVSFVTPIDITGSPFLGKAEAPVALAVFSDFQ
ncbi:MAG: hypothetical protein SCH71_13965 [Desulfobulbaceae bacterium]|nr:hypothetical protein [Desulfobulbaceae bacterium]